MSSSDSSSNSPSEYEDILLDHNRIYSPGTKLRLQPHTPLPPYGSNLYPLPPGMRGADMRLSEEERSFSLTRLVFDPRNGPRTRENHVDEDAEMVVEILDIIGRSPGRGYSPGPQKLLCQVLEAPVLQTEAEQKRPTEGQYLFLKIFDPLFWHKFVGVAQRSVKITTQADSAFSDEFGVYHHLYGHYLTGFSGADFDRTGFSSVAPEFFGGWTTTLTSSHDAFANQTRKVAVLALEYIEGVCLQQLFRRSGPTQETVTLDAKKTNGPTASFGTNQTQRMHLIAQLMDGTVAQEFRGVNHCCVQPKNVIITMTNMGQLLEKPRAVLVDYSQAVVDSLRTEPVKMWEYFPKKPHPIIRFSWSRLVAFEGWVPGDWQGPKHDVDDCPKLDRWILSTFGTLASTNPQYTTLVWDAPQDSAKSDSGS
ncbi:hypothetical protein LZ31DRAFT_500431 [Colletotrichum somersetense]|nr:hypothetical protein LZ31DRAFT_500431 [Colletotrichum somersetense]